LELEQLGRGRLDHHHLELGGEFCGLGVEGLPAAGEAANSRLVAGLVADGASLGAEQPIHELVDLGLVEPVAGVLRGGHD